MSCFLRLLLRVTATMLLCSMVWLVTALPVAAQEVASTESDAKPPPNFIVIFTDDQGYGDLGCFGATDLATPNLDRMADEGIRLTDFHVQAAVCSPSRAALLTGVYPKRAGVSAVLVPRHRHGLRKDKPTIAEVLKPAGYATACIGKWHLGHRPGHFPTERGFDFYFGIPYSNDMGRMRGTGIVDETRKNPDLPLMRNSEQIETEPDQRLLTRRYTEEAIKFIEQKRNRPFFLYFAHTFPHRPWFASDAFRGRSERGIYGDMIEEIDWSVGELLKTLRAQGIDENTLVVFTSDNGPAQKRDEESKAGSAGPLRGHKFSIYEGGHRVPFVARWPERIPAGTACDELTTAMDLMPTIANLADVGCPPTDGFDIFPMLSGQAGAESRYDELIHFKGARFGAIRKGKWKLIRHKSKKLNGIELYNLDTDLGESHDVAAEHPQLAKELLEAGLRIHASIKP